jgi:inhibitor of KinA
MGSVNEKIITPRKQQPRTKVLAGSIGIAGEQTGIYPFDSPGGWNIIGQTPLNLFDLKKENPVLLEPGDEIKFIPINIKEYKKIKENN